jgi:hypothetical protein
MLDSFESSFWLPDQMVELRTYRQRRQSRSAGRETLPLELTVCRSMSEVVLLGVRGECGC